ncbi:hypothetical protein [Vaginisenegalia massiliensis]|uniref:hypothetical protein n=1 Tax=Vaginisenegalia massiliensis TaxID=2058294 RepID=UPI000F52DFF2|nr:hypothetical protein [Vaginisenegalia massiliensis]
MTKEHIMGLKGVAFSLMGVCLVEYLLSPPPLFYLSIGLNLWVISLCLPSDGRWRQSNKLK